MSRQTRTGPAALAVGIALGGVALGALQAKRKQGRSPDDAPDFALRQRDGEYDLVGRSVTIRKPRDELFRFWRDFGNLARFMENLEKVEKYIKTKYKEVIEEDDTNVRKLNDPILRIRKGFVGIIEHKAKVDLNNPREGLPDQEKKRRDEALLSTVTEEVGDWHR